MAEAMTRDQWQDLARFAGIECHHRNRTAIQPAGTGTRISTICGDCGFGYAAWNPDSDWSDFGPLLLLLWPWLSERIEEGQLNVADNEECLLPLAEDFISAMNAPASPDKPTKVMQAGCLLGAAIGATMTDERK